MGHLWLQVDLLSTKVISGVLFCSPCPQNASAHWVEGSEHLFTWSREFLVWYLSFSGCWIREVLDYYFFPSKFLITSFSPPNTHFPTFLLCDGKDPLLPKVKWGKKNLTWCSVSGNSENTVKKQCDALEYAVELVGYERVKSLVSLTCIYKNLALGN